MGSRAKIKALIVDDFDNFRITVIKMLQEFGVDHVDSAIHGRDALKKCRTVDYDLVLCDYNLGPGKNGQQVLEQLRHEKRLRASSLFVLVSAETSKSTVMAAYDYEPDAYLTKPITAKTLYQRLNQLMRVRDYLMPVYRAQEAGDLAHAINECEQLADKARRHRNRCQRLLGRLLLESGEFDRAEALYRQVLEGRDLDWAQVGLALAKQGQNDWVAAQQWVEQALGTNSLCIRAYDALEQIHSARGDEYARQRVLAQAVGLSPLSIRRQQALGHQALENQDPASAAASLRQAVRLGEHSCHDDPRYHVAFVRAGADLARQAPEKAQTYQRDIQKTIGQFDKRFDDTEQRQQLDSAGGYYAAATGDETTARALLDKWRERDEASSLEEQIDWVACLDALGETGQRDELLNELIECHKGDERALRKMDRVLDNPVSEKSRKRVAQINREGISAYEQEDFVRAITAFSRATTEFPRHTGIALNLFQALIGGLSLLPDNHSYIVQARQVKNQLEILLDQNHPQYQRFVQLRQRLGQFVDINSSSEKSS